MTNLTADQLKLVSEAVAAAVGKAVAELTVAPATEKPSRKAPKEATKEYRRVRTNRLVDFGDDIGINLEGWTLEEVLESILSSEKGTLPKKLRTELPEGWVWGPKPTYYLANGEWPS